MFNGSGRSGVRRASYARIAGLRGISRYYLTGVDQVLGETRASRCATIKTTVDIRDDTANDDKTAELAVF